MVGAITQPRSSRAKSRELAERSRGIVSRVARPGVSTSLDANGIWAVLEDVPDPEIPAVSLVDLGIVREVTADRVTLTPTYSGCPATLVIEQMVRAGLDAAGFGHVEIATTLSPPWTTDWITEEGREKLRAYGIAPPRPRGERQVDCPQCGSAETEEVSRFGSTPCKAQWRCRACLEPFDLFKCH